MFFSIFLVCLFGWMRSRESGVYRKFFVRKRDDFMFHLQFATITIFSYSWDEGKI